MQFAYKIGWEKHLIHQEEELFMLYDVFWLGGWAVGLCGRLPGGHTPEIARGTLRWANLAEVSLHTKFGVGVPLALGTTDYIIRLDRRFDYIRFDYIIRLYNPIVRFDY